MLKRIILFLTSVLVSTLATASPLDFIKHVTQYFDYAEQEQQAVWPGFHPTKLATIIQFRLEDSVSAYAFNFNPKNPAWEKIIVAEHPIFYLADAKNLKINDVDNGKVIQVEGQSSFIDMEAIDFVERENLSNQIMSNRAGYYLKHESNIDTSNANFLTFTYDNFNNPELLKLFYLEDAALTKAQQTDAEKAEEALRDAVAIHQYRNSLSSAESIAYENAQEIINGTPIFIGWNTAHLDEISYKKMVQRTGSTPLMSLMGPLGLQNNIFIGFPRFASAVYGHALEKKLSNASWKKTVESDFKSISQMAINYYHFSNQQAESMVIKAKEKPEYNFNRINKIIDGVLLPYLKSLEQVKQEYKNLPGIEFRTSYFFTMVFYLLQAFHGDVIDDQFLVNDKLLLLKDINFTSTTHEFDFNHLPYAASNVIYNNFDLDEARSYTSFKLDANGTLTIDGSTISIQEFINKKMVQSFSKLIISDSHVHLSIQGPSVIDGSEGILKLNDIHNLHQFNLSAKPFTTLIYESESSLLYRLGNSLTESSLRGVQFTTKQ